MEVQARERLLARVRELPHDRAIQIVLTGGQAAGKTTVLESISHIVELGVVCIGESATELTRALGWKPSDFISEIRSSPATHVSERDLIQGYQQTIYQWQRQKEFLAQCRAEVMDQYVIVCDRGTLDGAVYLSDELEEFCVLNETTYEEELERYDIVLLFELLTEVEYCESRGRHKSYEEACARHERLKKIWGVHPGYFLIKGTKQEKLLLALDLIRRIASERRLSMNPRPRAIDSGIAPTPNQSSGLPADPADILAPAIVYPDKRTSKRR